MPSTAVCHAGCLGEVREHDVICIPYTRGSLLEERNVARNAYAMILRKKYLVPK